ncbi:hypothetical protein FNW02_33665 [Komarekiella sp. 'clone 1']|uniref:Uncharacterized protein n=1 Tax=Komarekiella delphini-convector SJRDD-AB1 TaxID=2593771 RepID=A0AA40T4Q4_9NOST|nr:hypothetical protein [Komarekiella delphini-convector]MBD6620587.1 hypothetical protein [Komarekiella delphini-convector SJRDD-AB1]
MTSSLPCRELDTDYLSLLSVWIDQALSNNLSVALDLAQAHKWLRQITDCLRYPEYECHEDKLGRLG